MKLRISTKIKYKFSQFIVYNLDSFWRIVQHTGILVKEEMPTIKKLCQEGGKTAYPREVGE
jgi:hypothetical protein